MTANPVISTTLPRLGEDEAASLNDALERSLIDRARHDPDAFETLYRRHHPAIFRYLARRTGCAHHAEDLSAEVFVTAMQKIRSYQHQGAGFEAWLYGIATRKANAWVRKQRRRREIYADESLHLAQDPAADDAPDFELAQRAMLALPPNFQAVLTLHHVEGMPLERIALVVGRPVGTIKSRLARARAAMREELERRSERHAK